MKQYLPSSINPGTVNDCAENKCINCFNNNGCIYRRGAFEMPQQESTASKSIKEELQQFIKGATEQNFNYRLFL